MSQQESYPYQRPFRLLIIAACLDKNWYASYGTTTINPDYFNTKEEKDLVKFVNTFYAEYKHAPSIDEIAAEFASADDLMQDLIVDVVEALDNKELNFAKKKAIEFARIQAQWVAVDHSITLFQQGKSIAEIWELYKVADKVGADVKDLGIDLLADSDTWLSADYQDTEKICTGLYHMDQHLGGGISRGELHYVIGPPGSGKTRALVNIGMGAASHISKANVLHLTLEMSAKKVARRYATRLTCQGLVKGEEIIFKQELQKHATKKLGGSIRIKQYPNKQLTMAELNRYLDALSIEGWEPDLIIVDYPTNMKHNTSVGEYRHQLADTAEELRGLVVERNVAMWAAAQANRGAFKKEIVDMDDIAECWDITATADGIYTICQTKTEKAENILRFYAAKVREEESNWIVRCKVDPALHIIESLECLNLADYLQLKEEKDEKSLKIIK